eukprot:360194-Chlamydomonas_euryale.AAC.6
MPLPGCCPAPGRQQQRLWHRRQRGRRARRLLHVVCRAASLSDVIRSVSEGTARPILPPPFALHATTLHVTGLHLLHAPPQTTPLVLWLAKRAKTRCARLAGKSSKDGCSRADVVCDAMMRPRTSWQPRRCGRGSGPAGTDRRGRGFASLPCQQHPNLRTAGSMRTRRRANDELASLLSLEQ